MTRVRRSPRRVLFLFGEHGLGKSTTMAALTARHGAFYPLDPDRFGNLATPSAYGYGPRDDRGRLALVNVMPPALRVPYEQGLVAINREETAAGGYFITGTAASETDTVVAHRRMNMVPSWLPLAARSGWEVHAVELRNSALAMRRRICRTALSHVAVDIRRNARILRAAARFEGPLVSHRNELVARMVDSVREDLAETERLYAEAEATPGLHVHRVHCGEGESPEVVGWNVAAAAGCSDVLGPLEEPDRTPIDPWSPRLDRSATGDQPPASELERIDEVLDAIDYVLEGIEVGEMPASAADLAALERVYDEIAAEAEARQPMTDAR